MGAVVNALAIIIAGVIGMKVKTGIPERINERVMEGLGLCVIAIGISGVLQGQDTLVLIISIVIGTLIGEWIDLDHKIISGVDRLQKRFQSKSGADNLSQGFISATMIFCVGSMVIVGSLESGLTGDNTTLYIKSLLDGITALLLASSLGAGVILSAIPVLIIEGGLTLLAGLLQPYLATVVVNEIIAVGSLLLIGLGLNMMKVTDLKVMNFTPAMILPAILMLFM